MLQTNGVPVDNCTPWVAWVRCYVIVKTNASTAGKKTTQMKFEKTDTLFDTAFNSIDAN